MALPSNTLPVFCIKNFINFVEGSRWHNPVYGPDHRFIAGHEGIIVPAKPADRVQHL